MPSPLSASHARVHASLPLASSSSRASSFRCVAAVTLAAAPAGAARRLGAKRQKSASSLERPRSAWRLKAWMRIPHSACLAWRSKRNSLRGDAMISQCGVGQKGWEKDEGWCRG
eukprot:969385-Rhodomonas_salina.2